ncbi:hypothetical protein LIER_19175 [Lithospermum erythrorhizon]|uniref:MULE transposase domain-containing protein n=1 Tax=Lithospermum erythrorhizon TaxID=34254 RepID=A0AAV3QHY8_LITER
MYKQQILTVVALDLNNGWWHIDWAVVEQENKDSWRWFIGFLIQDLKIVPTIHMTFISDKQKGLESAMYELIPGCEHRTCVQYLYKNFKLANKGGDLRDKLWKCARASNQEWFNSAMEHLKDVDEKAYEWLQTHAPEQNRWCKAFFPLTVKSDML